jgi:ribosomal protein L33
MIRLNSTAGTGPLTWQKKRTHDDGKMVVNKYDPVVRKHEYKEGKDQQDRS